MFLLIPDNYPNITFTWIILHIWNNCKIHKSSVKNNSSGSAQFRWPYNQTFSIDHCLIYFCIFMCKQLYKGVQMKIHTQKYFAFLLPSKAIKATHFFHFIMLIMFVLKIFLLQPPHKDRESEFGATWPRKKEQ